MLPFALLPCVGALSPDDAGAAFGHPLILLLLAGFLLSQVMESSGAHERLAVAVIRSLGARTGRRSVLAFLLTSALLSMWISNTATALMLLPVALAVIDRSTAPAVLAPPLLSGLAWGLSLIGVAVPLPVSPLLKVVLAANLASLVWRIAMRFAFTAREHGLGAGLFAVARIPVTNIVAIMAGRRAFVAYLRSLRGNPPRWDKTEHRRHPSAAPIAEAAV